MQRRCFMLGSLVGGLSAVPAFAAEASKKIASGTCSKAVYLTFDTGHMGIAQWSPRCCKSTRFPSHSLRPMRPRRRGSSLGDFWAPWWKARADEGHQLASHTFDHMYWLADIRDKATGQVTHFKVKPSAGPRAGQSYVVSADEYRQEIAAPLSGWRRSRAARPCRCIVRRAARHRPR
jgi:peptidoglycan/xylan/chitin deacetylase (PgdA/CDA1 family)